jgi:hypothetical protein
MNFLLSPDNKLNISNQDYDIEVLWYGLKNLINCYFKNLIDNKKNMVQYINETSNKLNILQTNKQYLEIYTEIHNFLYNFLEIYIKQFDRNYMITASESYNHNLIDTWITRYNKIDYVKKIKLPYDYNSYRTIDNMDKETSIYLKFLILGNIFKHNFNSLKLFYMMDDDFHRFMDYIIDNKLGKLFDIIAAKINLQSYYDYKNIKQKYIPIKFFKFIKHLY